jgi:hypothetical protein
VSKMQRGETRQGRQGLNSAQASALFSRLIYAEGKRLHLGVLDRLNVVGRLSVREIARLEFGIYAIDLPRFGPTKSTTD